MGTVVRLGHLSMYKPDPGDATSLTVEETVLATCSEISCLLG